MSDLSMLADPWDTPPVDLDPELLETSQRLMAKSEAIYTPEPDLSPEVSAVPEDAKDLRIRQLEQEQQRLFRRNVNLVAEVAQLRAANQRLMEQVVQLQQPSDSLPRWLTRWFRRSHQA